MDKNTSKHALVTEFNFYSNYLVILERQVKKQKKTKVFTIFGSTLLLDLTTGITNTMNKPSIDFCFFAVWMCNIQFNKDMTIIIKTSSMYQSAVKCTHLWSIFSRAFEFSLLIFQCISLLFHYLIAKLIPTYVEFILGPFGNTSRIKS